jgi:hypothetical protein
MRISKNPDYYNIYLSVHLSPAQAIQQQMGEVIKYYIGVKMPGEFRYKHLPSFHIAVTGQGFYSLPVSAWLFVFNRFGDHQIGLELSMNREIDQQKERTFVHSNKEINPVADDFKNISEIGNLILEKLSTNPTESYYSPWIAWTSNRGCWHFRPTDTAMAHWLQCLWSRQLPPFLATPDDGLAYIEQRCTQLLKLVVMDITKRSPWLAENLAVATSSEKDLVYALMGVYDALATTANHRIAAAAKSLVEKFLEFDRYCRLLDLPTDGEEFLARAGLILLVQRAIRELSEAISKTVD